jgi:hypothetical protein
MTAPLTARDQMLARIRTAIATGNAPRSAPLPSPHPPEPQAIRSARTSTRRTRRCRATTCARTTTPARMTSWRCSPSAPPITVPSSSASRSPAWHLP